MTTTIPAAWLPIESAPKDGTPVLLFARLAGLNIATNSPYSPTIHVGAYRTDLSLWTGSSYCDQREIEIEPTHWMPRPEFPECAAPGVSTVEDAQAVAWMDPDTLDVINADRKASWLADFGAGAAAKAATYTRALGDLRPAPAAGDALDAARYRAIRNPPYSDRYGDLYAMTFQGDGDIPLKGDALDAAADAAIAAQRKGGA